MNSPKQHREFQSSILATEESVVPIFHDISRGKAGSSSRIGTYLQFSDDAAAARTECWEDSACERGEKQVEVVEEEEEKDEEIEKNRRYLHAKLTRGLCRSWGIGLWSRPEAPGSRGWYRGERLSQSRATSFSERGLGIGCYSVSRPLLMLLLLPFSQQAPGVCVVRYMAARGAQRRTAIGVATPRFRRSGKMLALRSDCRMARRRRSGGIAGSLTARLTEEWPRDSVDRHLAGHPASADSTSRGARPFRMFSVISSRKLQITIKWHYAF